jgi:hypothetical protein
MGSVRLAQEGFLAWAGRALCDDDENVYLLVLPGSARGDTPSPREVLRISADGKKRAIFDPALGSRFAGAKELKALAMALDRDGRLFVLLWARWSETQGPGEKAGQYIVSFDRDARYRSHLEVDWHQMLVHQLELFGSGELLLRGRRTHTDQPRVAILSPGGRSLQDVRGWAGMSRGLDEPAPRGRIRFDHMVRGGDGRIYAAEHDEPLGKVVVYAFDPSGDAEEVFRLRPMGREPRMLGWLSAGSRFAAAYLRADAPEGSDQTGQWMVAVYRESSAGGELETLYAPAPSEPVCYQRRGSEDVFTFLTGSKLVKMSSR